VGQLKRMRHLTLVTLLVTAPACDDGVHSPTQPNPAPDVTAGSDTASDASTDSVAPDIVSSPDGAADADASAPVDALDDGSLVDAPAVDTALADADVPPTPDVTPTPDIPDVPDATVPPEGWVGLAGAGTLGKLSAFTPTADLTLYDATALCPGSITDNGHNDPLWRAVGYGDGRFIAAGGGFHDGYIRISDDLQSWQPRVIFSGTPQVGWLGDITYGNGIWVAVGGNGLKMYSTDGGDTWTGDEYWDLESGEPSFAGRGVAFGGGRFMAAGDGGRYALSTDGATWTPTQEVAGSDGGGRPVYGAGGFLFFSPGSWNGGGFNDTTVAFIPDGSDTHTSSTSFQHVGTMTYGDGRFTALHYDAAFVSTDGVTWNQTCATCCEGAVCANAVDPNAANPDCGNLQNTCSIPNQVKVFEGTFYGIRGGNNGVAVATSQDGLNWVGQGEFVSDDGFRGFAVGRVFGSPLPQTSATPIACDPTDDGDDSTN